MTYHTIALENKIVLDNELVGLNHTTYRTGLEIS